MRHLAFVSSKPLIIHKQVDVAEFKSENTINSNDMVSVSSFSFKNNKVQSTISIFHLKDT